MTIEYMAEQDCFKLKYTDAFKYVRARCNANVVEAVYAWLFGKTVEVNAGQQYMENNSSTTLGKQFGVALSTRKTAKEKEKNDVNLLNVCQRDLQKEHANLSKTRNDLIQKSDKITSQLQNNKATNSSLCERLKNLTNTNQELKDNFKQMTKRHNDALTELSAIAGNKLTKDNAAIADLSDPNRPTKLGEKLSELYDNEWTDACEALETINKRKSGIKNDNDADPMLLANMLKRLHLEVKSYLQDEQKKMKDIKINKLKEALADDRPDKDIIFKDLNLWTDEKVSLHQTINNDLKEESEKINDITRSVVKSMENNYSKYTTDNVIKLFLKASIEVVLFMELTSPPLVFAWQDKGETHDKELFRHYTKSGTNVDFTVWPALLLQEDGSVLAKGVIQPQPEPVVSN